jgi:mitochondrial chaperone BCS1
LLEDIDALFKKREQMMSGGISFSGFLNALDGVRS